MFRVNLGGLIVAATTIGIILASGVFAVFQVIVIGNRIVETTMTSPALQGIITAMAYLSVTVVGLKTIQTVYKGQRQLQSKLDVTAAQNLMMLRKLKSQQIPAGYARQIGAELGKRMLYEAKSEAVIAQKRYEALRYLKVPTEWWRHSPRADQIAGFLANLLLIQEGKMIEAPKKEPKQLT